MAKHSVREELYGVLAFVGALWFVFVLELILPFRLQAYGVTPRTLKGLVGIPAAPFLHANLAHLVSNTIPLTVLLLLLAGSKGQSWKIVASIVFLGGGLLWLFGRPATHIGASGLIYGLIAYLLVAGVREGRFLPMIVSVVVGVLYGGTLAAGVLPSWGSRVSWDGHLFGAVAGAAVAWLLTREGRGEKAGGQSPISAD